MVDDKEKILIISPLFYPLLGGMEVQVMLLGQELIRQGYRVDVLTEQTKEEFKTEDKINGINVFRLRRIKERNAIGFIELALNAAKFLLKERKEYKLIIIRTFTFYGILVGILKWIRLIQTPTVITAETGGEDDDVATLKNRRGYKFMLFFFNQHNYLNSICDDNYRHLTEFGIPENKLTRIYNGVNFTQYDCLDYPKKIINYFFLGRLAEGKGLDELLEAYTRLKREFNDVSLHIAGDGIKKNQIVKYIKDNKNLDIIYHGYIEGAEKEKIFEACDCMVLPSYSEGFPVSVVEAISHKRVVICSDVSDIKRLFGKVLYVCAVKDAEDLYEKMKNAHLNYNKQQINYDEFRKEFSIESVANKFIALSK